MSVTFLLLAVGLLTLIGLAVLLVALLFRTRHALPPDDIEPALQIDVRALPDFGPPNSARQLEMYHIPMRIAALVLAPAGRDTTLPPPDELPQILEQLVPNLMQIVDRDQPFFRQWPAQVSSHGFVRRFFQNVTLPGENGKGTCWCAVAGRFEADRRTVLIGLVLRSAAANSLNQMEIQRDSQWLDVLRVR